MSSNKSRKGDSTHVESDFVSVESDPVSVGVEVDSSDPVGEFPPVSDPIPGGDVLSPVGDGPEVPEDVSGEVSPDVSPEVVDNPPEVVDDPPVVEGMDEIPQEVGAHADPELKRTLATLRKLFGEAIVQDQTETIVPVETLGSLLTYVTRLVKEVTPKKVRTPKPGEVVTIPRVDRPKPTEPTGKRALIAKLALRPCGVSVSELVSATGWSKCPWSWTFVNPHGDGICNQFPHLQLSKQIDGRNVRYYLTDTRKVDVPLIPSPVAAE